MGSKHRSCAVRVSLCSIPDVSGIILLPVRRILDFIGRSFAVHDVLRIDS